MIDWELLFGTVNGAHLVIVAATVLVLCLRRA